MRTANNFQTEAVLFDLDCTLVDRQASIRRFSETIVELSTGELMEAFSAFRLDHTSEQYKERIYNKTASLFRTDQRHGHPGWG